MLNSKTRNDYTGLLDSLFLLCILGLLFCIFLGSRPLFVPDEGRYAEIAREMAISKDYITPYLDGIKYFEKPVLYYWLGAIVIKFAGINLWFLRGINVFISLFGCLITYFTARQLYDRITGLLASLILGTSILYYLMTHMIALDIPVSVFLTACLYSFLLAMQYPDGYRRRFLIWSAAIWSALAVLTKGMIGIVFPTMIIFSWLTICKQWKQLKISYIPSAIMIFLIIALPWHLLINQRNPEFFSFYFINQHLLRYLTNDVGHHEPFWFFLVVLAFGFLPWVVFLPQAIMRTLRHKHVNDTFFLLWAAVIFIFFSLSSSKLFPYILPVFPALALLVARYIIQSVRDKSLFGLKWGFTALIFLSLLISIACFSATYFIPVPNPRMVNYFLISAGCILAIGTILAGILAFKRIHLAIITTVLTMLLFLPLLIGSLPYADARNLLPFTQLLKPVLTPEDEIVTFGQYYQDLPFYLERRVSIVNWRNELSYGLAHQKIHDWVLEENNFWDKWHGQKRLFVVMDRNSYDALVVDHPQEKFYLLGKTVNNALFSNRPLIHS